MASLALKSWRLQIFPKVFGSPTAASLKEIDDLTHQDPVALPPHSLFLPEAEEKEPEKSEKSEKPKAEVVTLAQFASVFSLVTGESFRDSEIPITVIDPT